MKRSHSYDGVGRKRMAFDEKGRQAQWVESKSLLDQAKTSTSSSISGTVYNAARILAKREGHTEEAAVLEGIAKKHGAKIKGHTDPSSKEGTYRVSQQVWKW